LEYQAGIFQGTPDGGSVETDNTDDKDFAGRIIATPFLRTEHYALRGLGLGIAGSYGERRNTPAGFRTQARTRYFCAGAFQDVCGQRKRVGRPKIVSQPAGLAKE
jgi:phosphate-selective porin OprO/OprP